MPGFDIAIQIPDSKNNQTRPPLREKASSKENVYREAIFRALQLKNQSIFNLL